VIAVEQHRVALSGGARQELFISTDLKKEEVERALRDAGALVV